jgi:hypothetical protein
MKFTYETFSCEVAFYVIDAKYNWTDWSAMNAIDWDTFDTNLEHFLNENPLFYITARFYDASCIFPLEKLRDYVVVDRGFGTLTLIMKTEESGSMSGFLDARVFATQEMVKAAVEFVREHLPSFPAREADISYHISLFRCLGYVEYTGE